MKEHIEPEDNERIAWHPAFFEAIQLELVEYRNHLEFISEYPLNTEPLRIDVVIVKKSTDVPIKKNIARIFRKINIVEYKSPDDYLAIKDFYLVYAYACLYMVLNGADIKDLTLTFVESRHPRELLRHLGETRGFSVENPESGIYTVKGDILPIQIIDSRELAVDENIWLKNLDNKLEVPEIERIDKTVARLGKGVPVRAYLDALIRANKASIMEVYTMEDLAIVMERWFKEAGIVPHFVTRAYEEKAMEIAQNMLKDGFPEEQIARLSGLDITKIKALSA